MVYLMFRTFPLNIETMKPWPVPRCWRTDWWLPSWWTASRQSLQTLQDVGVKKKLRLVFVGERHGSKCQVHATRTSDKHNELSERLQLQRPVSTSASVTSYFINLKKKRGIIKNHCNHSVSPHYNLHNLPNHPAEKSSPRSSHISPCISRIHDDRFGSSIFEPVKADFNSFSTLARNSWWFRGKSASNVRVEEWSAINRKNMRRMYDIHHTIIPLLYSHYWPLYLGLIFPCNKVLMVDPRGSWLSLLPYQHGSSSSTKLWCHHRLEVGA